MFTTKTLSSITAKGNNKKFCLFKKKIILFVHDTLYLIEEGRTLLYIHNFLYEIGRRIAAFKRDPGPGFRLGIAIFFDAVSSIPYEK